MKISWHAKRSARTALFVLLLTLVAIPTMAPAADQGDRPEPAPKNMLAIRLASYYDAQDEALAHAASCGLKYVFMNVVRPDEVEATQKKLAKHGLRVAVFRGEADLASESSVDELAEQLATCETMGVRYMFLSPKYSSGSPEVVIERLKRLGPIAKKHGVIIGLETHPPLGADGDVHVKTMRAINHPNIRVNFDTGNITYYNKGADAVAELKKCIDYVGTVEIKDHNGEFETWNFPPLGKGKVDIPGVIDVLPRGYAGPITIEVEGVQGVTRSKDQIKKDIAESIAYLRPLVERSNLSGPDYIMLVGYFVLMLGIGAYFYRFMRGMKVYFTGGNQIPWWLSGVSFYMSSFSAYGFVIYSGLCFRYGWVGVTMFWVTVPATIFSVMLFAARWRRARIDSPVEFLESRYSALVRQLFVWTGLPVGIIDDSLKLIATGTIVHVGMGFSIEASVIACGIIMVAYTFMGGLWAVTVTDFVQFVILAVAVVVVFPLAIVKVGGFSGLVNNSPAGFFAPVNEQYNWIYIVLLTGLYCVAYSSTNWHLIQKYFCVATERDARKVGWLVVGLNIIGPPLIFTPAIAARQFLPADMIDKEVYPRLCAVLLPVGMLGLIIAAMFSATMANLSSHFNVRASVLTNDVYRRLLRPRATEKELVVVGRAMTALVGGLTILLAFHLAQASAPALFKIMVTVFGGAVAPLGIPMLLGLVSRRINALSATVAVISGLAVSITLFFALPEGFEGLGIHWERETVIFAVSTLTVLALMYGLSAIWPMGAGEAERAALFHRRLDSPIGELPEDRPSVEPSGGAVSPFRIVGVCVACIGILMLCVQPFIGEWLPRVLNIVLGLTLLAIGWSMTWLSKRARRNAGT